MSYPEHSDDCTSESIPRKSDEEHTPSSSETCLAAAHPDVETLDRELRLIGLTIQILKHRESALAKRRAELIDDHTRWLQSVKR